MFTVKRPLRAPISQGLGPCCQIELLKTGRMDRTCDLYSLRSLSVTSAIPLPTCVGAFQNDTQERFRTHCAILFSVYTSVFQRGGGYCWLRYCWLEPLYIIHYLIWIIIRRRKLELRILSSMRVSNRVILPSERFRSSSRCCEVCWERPARHCGLQRKLRHWHLVVYEVVV